MPTKIIINFVLFQIGWFACVIGAAKQLPWLGVVMVMPIVAWHLNQSKHAKPELFLLLVSIAVGSLFDQLLQDSSLVTYQSHGWTNMLVPVWILALWAAFTTTLNVSLRWMRNRWLIAISFGLIGGPLAYVAAEKLGAVTLDIAPLSYVALGVGWGILTPVLLMLSEKFDGFVG
jgi:Protein of unknown function (DUF2878)